MTILLVQNILICGTGGAVKGPGGRVQPLEGGTGMYRGHDPLFSGQWGLPSLPISHQCTAHAPPIFKC